MSLNKKERVMKSFYYIIVVIFLSINTIFADRVAMHTITNFDVNTSTNKFSFDIYSRSTGSQSIFVGLTSYYFNFNNAGLNTPVLSNINPKYTTGSPSGDYNEMSVQIVGGKIGVSISLDLINGNGIGAALSTNAPNGELICTVTLNIINQNLTTMLSWDISNSAMNTPTLFVVTNNYQGAFDAALPVELSTFTASANQNKVDLKWQTKTEVNNYGFNIERRISTGEWNKIGFVQGHGNSNSPKQYNYTDKDLFADGSKFQYRLKQVDIDGKFEYSDVVEVQVIPTQFELSQNYPNPFNPGTTIRFSLPKQTQLKLNVYNMLGELVETIAEGNYEAGNYKINFNASNLTSGVYIYRIESSDFVQVRKMILIK
jgi:hypothetical protein